MSIVPFIISIDHLDKLHYCCKNNLREANEVLIAGICVHIRFFIHESYLHCKRSKSFLNKTLVCITNDNNLSMQYQGIKSISKNILL